jgi:hypothetical protein
MWDEGGPLGKFFCILVLLCLLLLSLTGLAAYLAATLPQRDAATQTRVRQWCQQHPDFHFCR